MYSRELLYKITKNNNCFRKVNLKTAFNSDSCSGRNTFKIKDCAFLDRNRVQVSSCLKDGQVKVTKICVKRNKAAKMSGCFTQTVCEKDV